MRVRCHASWEGAMMAVVLARLIVQAIAAMSLVVGGLIMAGIGHIGDAVAHVLICYMVIMVAAPNPEDRAAFERFQKDRMTGPPP
jgi:hypothetical protein